MGTGPAIAEAAAAIASGAPPDWLAPTLQSAALEHLAAVVSTWNAFPTRAELRDGLTKAYDAARVLQEIINDGYFLRFIERSRAAATSTPPSINNFLTFANELNFRLLPALAGARDSIRVGRGADKSKLNPDGLSPHEVCATWVAVAWVEVHGRPVPHTAAAAHRACNLLWQAAEGGLQRHWGNALTGWRNDLESAKSADHAHHFDSLRRRFVAARCGLQVIPR
jgi:hypothetical protein